jgi:hypothetical protein
MPQPKRARTTATVSTDPTSDGALQALAPTYAAPPDIPVSIQRAELASLARLSAGPSIAPRLAKIGVGSDKLALLAAFAKRLDELEKRWTKARGAVHLSATDKKLVAEAEALDSKLVAGGRWALRHEPEAQAELTRIAEGSGLADTIQDLRDLVAFWSEHEDALGQTDIRAKDLARASSLADVLDQAAAKESTDVDAAGALELRNRCFWASNELASEVREGGRYALRDQPKIAAKFTSRHRVTANRRARAKKKSAAARAAAPAVAP